jgi:hypothetical protein
MADEIQDGEVNLDLLLGDPAEAKNALDYYATGIYAVQQLFPAEGSSAPDWFMKALDSIGVAYSGTTESWVKDKVDESLRGLVGGGTAKLPGWACPWEKLSGIFRGGSVESLLTPISHCLKTMGDHQGELPSPIFAKLIIGMVLGDIGAAIHRARQGGSSAGFEKELKSGMGSKATIKDLLDLYYMFGLCSAVLRAGHQVEVLGTASEAEGGPDFKITCSGHGQVYYVEANRKEPTRNQMEKDTVWAAIDEKAAKVAPSQGARHAKWDPCLLSIDITSIEKPGGTEDLDGALLTRGPCGEYIYRGYSDVEFNARLKTCSDALAAAAVRTALLRKRGYGVGGVLLTRHQYLQIDAVGIMQAEGAVLILHKDWENRIPTCIARQVYLVDDACIPSELL